MRLVESVRLVGLTGLVDALASKAVKDGTVREAILTSLRASPHKGRANERHGRQRHNNDHGCRACLQLAIVGAA